jgi:hypothetical protein
MLIRPLALLRQHAIALLALFVALGGSSYAAVSAHGSGSSKHVLLGCVGKNTGTLRIVDSSIRCGTLETPISFNQEGQPGKRGPQGKRGPIGKRGPEGKPGANGHDGATGAPGAKGDAGAPGAAGAKGDAGTKGETGATGPKGDPGPTGATGATGPKGDPGAKGDTGATGPKGDAGATGADGQSVTSVAEAPGAHCSNGGVKYTSASGDDYVCNGGSDTAAVALTKLETVDGSGSGLDADTLDGIDSSQLVRSNQFAGLFDSRFTTAFANSIGTLFGAPDDSADVNAAGGGEVYIGETFLTATSFAPPGTAFAAGQVLPINQYTALFSLLGNTFGGDGVTTFQLPDLRKQAPRGLHYVIAINGGYPTRP